MAEGEAHTEPDLTEAHDEAGAADVDADALQRAYVDRLRAMEAQQGAAHPGFGAGMASMAMQVCFKSHFRSIEFPELYIVTLCCDDVGLVLPPTSKIRMAVT